jgi:hypothetical protein
MYEYLYAALAPAVDRQAFQKLALPATQGLEPKRINSRPHPRKTRETRRGKTRIHRVHSRESGTRVQHYSYLPCQDCDERFPLRARPLNQCTVYAGVIVEGLA